MERIDRVELDYSSSESVGDSEGGDKGSIGKDCLDCGSILKSQRLLLNFVVVGKDYLISLSLL